jgi:hypothetical protein
MLVRPLPGVRPDRLRTVFSTEESNLTNLCGGSPDHTMSGWLKAYLEWARWASVQLSSVVNPSDVNRLVFTRHYDRLLQCLGFTNGSPEQVVNGFLSLEIDQRAASFQEVTNRLAQAERDWSGVGS